MHTFIAPCFEIHAQTWTLSGRFATGWQSCSLIPTLIWIDLVCFTSCIELSLVQTTFHSSPLQQYKAWQKPHLLCSTSFGSDSNSVELYPQKSLNQWCFSLTLAFLCYQPFWAEFVVFQNHVQYFEISFMRMEGRADLCHTSSAPLW